MQFRNKTVFISGGSRGIGKAIALRLAGEGANIILAAKTVQEHPKLEGTIYTAASEIEAAGGKALPVPCDIRFEDQVELAVSEGVKTFGGIDIVINNASAIALTGTENTEIKKFDLMFDINVRGSFLVVKTCLPYLKVSDHAHILTLSPPLDMDLKWLAKHQAYTISKYNMTMMALGWAEEFKQIPIASNTLWPKTIINTAAIRQLPGGEDLLKMSRNAGIVADAAFHILSSAPGARSGNCFIDEKVLLLEGISNLDKYAVTPGAPLFPDLFLD